MTQRTRLNSGRVPVTLPVNVSPTRYQFLGLDSAEPNLGVSSNGNVLTTDINGNRTWTNSLSLSTLSTSGITTVTNTTNSLGSGTGALQVSGGVTIAQDLWVIGNVYAGNLMGVTANIVTVQDNLLYLNRANTYPYNYSIGLYSHYIGGPANTYVHTAITRQPNDNTWWFLSNIAEPSPATGNINVYDSNRILDSIQAGNINLRGNVIAATIIGSSATINGIANVNLLNSSGNVLAQAAVFNSVTTNGTETVQLLNSSGNVLAQVATVGAVQASGMIYANSTASSTSVTSGALQVAGGAGIQGNLNAGSLTIPGAVHNLYGNVSINGLGNPSSASTLALISGSLLTTIFLANASGGSYNPTTIVNDVLWTFSNGNQNYGNLTIAGWSATASGLRFRTDINQITAPGQFVISNATVSTTTTTGALLVTGGVGVQGSLTGANIASTAGVYAQRGGTGEIFLGTDSNGQIELGQPGRASAGAPYMDWHSSQNSPDYDVRIQASGGTSGQSGVGNLNIVAFNTIFSGNVVPVVSNVYTLGNTTNYFSTTYSKAVLAQYADLAENYLSDAAYAPGTVVQLGGTNEITVCNQDASSDVFGVVSTKPAYLMNSTLAGDNVLPVAMQGRTPVKVAGLVKKGDRLIAAGGGVARAALASEITAFNVIGRALEDKTVDGITLVEAVVRHNS